MSEESRLIRDILGGDLRAFRHLIGQYEGLINKMAYRMIAEKEERDEVIQDIYLAIFNKLESFRSEAKLSTWIARIAYYKCVDYYKRKGRKNVWEKLERFSDKAQEVNESSLASTPFNKLVDKEKREILDDHINRLPKNYKVILNMYHRDEMSYKEIGEVLNMPEGTVKNYLFRARKRLKESLVGLYMRGEFRNG